MLVSGITSFYKVENGKRLYYDVSSKAYKAIPGGEVFIVMKNFETKLFGKTVPAEPII